MNKIRNYWRNKRGITLVWGAFFLVLCLMFLGLAVDIAYMYVVKNQLQVAADSGSLAGAARLDCSNDPVQNLARQEAISFAGKNTAAGQAVEVQTDNSNTLSPDNDITVGYWNRTTRIYTPDNGTGTSTVNAIEVRPQKVSGLTG